MFSCDAISALGHLEMLGIPLEGPNEQRQMRLAMVGTWIAGASNTKVTDEVSVCALSPPRVTAKDIGAPAESGSTIAEYNLHLSNWRPI